MDSVTKARIITFSFFLFVLIILIYLFKRNKKETFKNKIVNTPNNHVNPVNRFKNDFLTGTHGLAKHLLL